MELDLSNELVGQNGWGPEGGIGDLNLFGLSDGAPRGNAPFVIGANEGFSTPLTLVSVTPVPPVPYEDKAQLKCALAFSKAGAKYQASRLKALAKCHDALAKGKPVFTDQFVARLPLCADTTDGLIGPDATSGCLLEEVDGLVAELLPEPTVAAYDGLPALHPFSTPKTIDFEEIPNVLVNLHGLLVAHTDDQTGRVVELAPLTAPVAAEQGDGPLVVGNHVDEIEVEGIFGQRGDGKQKGEDPIMTAMRTGQAPFAAGEMPDRILGQRGAHRLKVALVKGAEKVADTDGIGMFAHGRHY